MTTALLSLAPQVTVEFALSRLKSEAPALDVLYYVYLLDPDGGLCGVVSMRELLTALPDLPLSAIQTTRLVTLHLQAGQGDVVELFIKYGFRALPVVDDRNHLKGAIRLRTALEILAQRQV
jgi:Mg/Co/Ni transporter MgtE